MEVFPEALFYVGLQIDQKNNEFNISDFFEQLKLILDDELYNELYNNLNQLSVITFGKPFNLNYTMEQMLQELFVTDLSLIAQKKENELFNL